MADSWQTICSSRTCIMGVINVTPDSFSGDGIYRKPEKAGDVASALVAEGADILDIGGESTRPGYAPVSAQEELERVIPTIRVVRDRVSVPVSIDTSKAEVAEQALAEGASIVNDVSGLQDPEMVARVADADASLILVHNGPIPDHGDAMGVIVSDLQRQIGVAHEAGINRSKLMVDPGLGMGKGWQSNVKILQRLDELQVLAKPVLVGPSRKAMISYLLGVGIEDRLEGSLALVAIAITRGANIVRVHDVLQVTRVARTVDALRKETVVPASSFG